MYTRTNARMNVLTQMHPHERMHTHAHTHMVNLDAKCNRMCVYNGKLFYFNAGGPRFGLFCFLVDLASLMIAKLQNRPVAEYLLMWLAVVK